MYQQLNCLQFMLLPTARPSYKWRASHRHWQRCCLPSHPLPPRLPARCCRELACPALALLSIPLCPPWCTYILSSSSPLALHAMMHPMLPGQPLAAQLSVSCSCSATRAACIAGSKSRAAMDCKCQDAAVPPASCCPASFLPMLRQRVLLLSSHSSAVFSTAGNTYLVCRPRLGDGVSSVRLEHA